eukprot:2564446-Prymnesium_polylepis.1
MKPSPRRSAVRTRLAKEGGGDGGLPVIKQGYLLKPAKGSYLGGWRYALIWHPRPNMAPTP